MRSTSYLLFICLVALSCGSKSKGIDDFALIDSIYQEPECSSAGGTCVIAKDCSALTKQTGLCPKQADKGVECCYGLSRRETRCQKLGGECMSEFCNQKLVLHQAKDCKNLNCCLLV